MYKGWLTIAIKINRKELETWILNPCEYTSGFPRRRYYNKKYSRRGFLCFIQSCASKNDVHIINKNKSSLKKKSLAKWYGTRLKHFLLVTCNYLCSGCSTEVTTLKWPVFVICTAVNKNNKDLNHAGETADTSARHPNHTRLELQSTEMLDLAVFRTSGTIPRRRRLLQGKATVSSNKL